MKNKGIMESTLCYSVLRAAPGIPGARRCQALNDLQEAHLSRREFTVPGEYVYNRKSPGRWIVSHLLRYPWLPVVAAITGIGESVMLSYGAVVVGQAFNLLLSPQRSAGGLLRIAAFAVGVRLAQALLLLVVTWAFEMIGKRLERDAREELMISLLGKSQTFHNRQQVGDVMARATNDMRQLNAMVNPGMSL